jgi:hypothetical protein
VNNTIQNVIAILNSHNTSILNIQKGMLLARVQRAGLLGDVDAQRFLMLCEMDLATATSH